MRSCQNKKGRWKWREFKGVKQVAKWVGKTDWDQAKVKAGGGRKQGRERRLRKTQWAGMQGEWENKERGSQEPSGPE